MLDQPLASFSCVRKLITKHLKNMLCQAFSYFTMPGNRLRNPRIRVLIPIMISTMTDENTSLFFDFLDEINSFHPTANSPYFRIWGIFPELISS